MTASSVAAQPPLPIRWANFTNQLGSSRIILISSAVNQTVLLIPAVKSLACTVFLLQEMDSMLSEHVMSLHAAGRNK